MVGLEQDKDEWCINDLFIIVKRGCILLLNKNVGRIDRFLLTNLSILLVLRIQFDLRFRRSSVYCDGHAMVILKEPLKYRGTSNVRLVLFYCPMTRRDRVNDSFVDRPDGIPFQ